jgi:hypothetical protein
MIVTSGRAKLRLVSGIETQILPRMARIHELLANIDGQLSDERRQHLLRERLLWERIQYGLRHIRHRHGLSADIDLGRLTDRQLLSVLNDLMTELALRIVDQTYGRPGEYVPDANPFPWATWHFFKYYQLNAGVSLDLPGYASRMLGAEDRAQAKVDAATADSPEEHASPA